MSDYEDDYDETEEVSEESEGTVVQRQYVADYGAVVLGRVLPHRLDEYEYAADRLSLDHFRDGIQRTFWAVLADYWGRYGELFPASHMTDLLTQKGVDSSRILVITTAYDSYASAEVSPGEFRAAVDQLRDARDRQQTGEAITTAFDILERGLDVDGERLEGHSAARDYLAAQMGDIEDREVAEETPDGDVRSEAERLIKLYEDSHGQEETHGTEFGIASLDQETGGIQPGELCLIAAFTSQGKSQVCSQMAWHSVIKQQRGVFLATTETVRDVMIRRILSRHSREPKFGLPEGLNSKHIQKGTLSDKERQVYFDVVEDFTKTAALCHIAQMPAKATLEYVAHRAAKVNRASKIDSVIIDYLQLFEVEGQSKSEREDYNRILRQAKRMATTFDNGRGVAVVSPWQVRREAYHAAMEALSYTLGSLSDTSEADKAPDLILALLRPQVESNSRLAKMQILKHRDGPTMDPFDIEVDYRTSYLGESGSSAPISSYSPSYGALSGNQQSVATALLNGNL